MPSLNKVELIGHLGKDAENRTTTNDLDVTNFSIATSEKYTKNNEKVEKTTWHKITCFNQPEFIKNLKKGDLVYIDGKIEHNQYEDKEGNKKYFTNIIPNRFFGVLVLKKKNDTGGQNTQEDAPQNNGKEVPQNNGKDNEDLPF